MADAYEQLTVAATENKPLTEEDRKLLQAINELTGDTPGLYRHSGEPPTGREWKDLREWAHTGKRGRPKMYVIDEYHNNQADYSLSSRALQNRVNAWTLWLLLFDLWDIGAITYKLQDFYDQSGDGSSLRHQGIGEQIGRMLNEGLINEYHAVQLAKRAAYLCEYNGYRSKDVERMLRYVHKEMKSAVKK